MPFDPISFSEALKALRRQPKAVQVITQPKYIVYQDGDKYCAQNGFTNAVEKCDSDASTVINYALSNLTPGRRWKEMVVLKGQFDLTNPIVVPSYTRLVIDGYLVLANWNPNNPVIMNSLAVSHPQYTYYPPQIDQEIEIVGGKILGSSTATIYLYQVDYFKITGVSMSWFGTGIRVVNCKHGIISETSMWQISSAGIAISGGNNILVLDNIIIPDQFSTDAVVVSNGSNTVVIEGNFINVTNNGIVVSDSSHVIISNNRVYWTSNNGVNIAGSSRITIVGNFVLSNGNAGIYVGASGTVKSYYVTIVGNIVGDDRSPPGQKYGIQFAYDATGSYVENSLVAGNIVYNNTVAQIDAKTYPYSNNFVVNNLGFMTEDYGSVTLPAGSTSVTVQTKLSIPIDSVVITPIGQPPPGKLWVTIGSDGKSFTINTDVAPSVDLVIHYQVKGAM